MSPHIKIVAILNILFNAIGLLAIGLIALLFFGAGLFSGDAGSFGFSLFVIIFGGGLFAMFTIPGILAGVGLLKKKEWARILAIILAFFDLLYFPYGTALGIYILWVLFHGETVQSFARESKRPNVSAGQV